MANEFPDRGVRHHFERLKWVETGPSAKTSEQRVRQHPPNVGRLAKAVRFPKADIKVGHIALGSHGWEGQRYRTHLQHLATSAGVTPDTSECASLSR